MNSKPERPRKTARKRLDEIVVDRGWAESKTSAKALILSGKIRRGTEILDKPGKAYTIDIELTIEAPPKFVSRGGEKLEAFLKAYPVALQGVHGLDVGASTGGFTDCILQLGAASVTCIDVGRAQLHPKLLRDTRVTNLEQVNARYIKPGQLPRENYDLIVLDLSFISLKKILPAVWPFLTPDKHLIALVKPQFEAKREEVNKGSGVIRNPEVQERTLNEIREFSKETLPGCEELGWIPSPIRGASGNREFLLGLKKNKDNP